LAETISKGAQKLVEAGESDLTVTLFRRALSRDPSAEELTTARQVLGDRPDQQRVEDLLWMICMLPEFQVVR
jgi:hypothetical protein